VVSLGLTQKTRYGAFRMPSMMLSSGLPVGLVSTKWSAMTIVL
jgi:hypothetical protein